MATLTLLMAQNILLSRFQKSLSHLASLGIITLWMRIGYAAKGIIYLIVGLFAVGETLGLSLPLIGTEGTLRMVTQQPLGLLFLLVLSVGIAGYAFWRFVQALADPEHSGNRSPKRLAQRIAYAISGLTYTSVAYGAAELVDGVQSAQDDTIEDLTAQLLESSWGLLLLVLAGLVVIGVGLVYIYGGLSKAFISQFQASCHSHITTFATRLGQIGYTARGAAFTVIGASLIKAVLLAQSEPAGGLQNALKKIEAEPYGRLALGAVGAGFAAYALYALLVARYRRFKFR